MHPFTPPIDIVISGSTTSSVVITLSSEINEITKEKK